MALPQSILPQLPLLELPWTDNTVSEQTPWPEDKGCKILFFPCKKAEDPQRLVLAHRDSARAMALSILKRWHAYLAPAELDSSVDLALCEAAVQYKNSCGSRFSTFLYYFLKGQLASAISQSQKLAAHHRNATEIDDQAAQLAYDSEGGTSPLARPDEQYLCKERVAVLHRVCESLEIKERKVIELSFYQELSTGQIAEQTGLSRKQVAALKAQALRKIRCRLARG